MKRIEMTSEWLSNWTPTRRTEISDRGCKGLVLRGGPTSKVFFRWEDARDEATGAVRRRRVRLGVWPALSLNDARKMINDAKEADAVEGTGDETVEHLAKAYQRDILSKRDTSSAAWFLGHHPQPRPRRQAQPAATPVRRVDARSVRTPTSLRSSEQRGSNARSR